MSKKAASSEPVFFTGYVYNGISKGAQLSPIPVGHHLYTTDDHLLDENIEGGSPTVIGDSALEKLAVDKTDIGIEEEVKAYGIWQNPTAYLTMIAFGTDLRDAMNAYLPFMPEQLGRQGSITIKEHTNFNLPNDNITHTARCHISDMYKMLKKRKNANAPKADTILYE
ncbi:MAG: hypothetical protein ABIC95_02090 [archaeon]